jgi:hypothetical protein
VSFQFGNSISFAWKKLSAGDYVVRQFQANKTWEFNTIPTDINYYENNNFNVYRVLYPENHRYFGNVINLSSSLYQRSFDIQTLDPKLLWYYLDHSYYTVYSDFRMADSSHDENPNNILWESSSIFVIPMRVFGEGIKPGSLSLANYSTHPSYSYSLLDDKNGNLLDTSFDTTKFISDSYSLMYVGFNEKYREYNYKNNKTSYVSDTSENNNIISISNPNKINYFSGIPTTDTNEPTGVSAAFNGAYLTVAEYERFNFNRSNNFAFSFWINIPSSQSLETHDHNYLFSKNTITMIQNGDDHIITSSYTEKFPFDISIRNRTSSYPYTINFKQQSNVEIMQVTSSALTTGSWHHVVCQKTGSNYQIYIDGTLNVSYNKIMTKPVNNDHYFYIAGDGTENKTFSGSLDEIRVYSKGLTSTEISYLYNNSLGNGYAYQTSRIGNIFYKNGMVVVSDPRPKYKNALLGESGSFDYSGSTYGFDGRFKSTVTLYEHEFICKIRKNEFNFTQNPSLFSDINLGPKLIDTYASHKDFNPYITTIGLYNDNRDLIAIAKLANPLIKRDDVDMNIIVRFDM